MNLQQKITKFIKGETMFEEQSVRIWRMIFFVLILLILMIRSGHLTDEKVLLISKLKKIENEKRAEYIALRSQAMRLKMETTIENKVKDLGLKTPKKPAQVIREIETNKTK